MRASLAVLCVLWLPLGGCVRVKAWERGKLASPTMAPPWAQEGMAAEYDAKVLETQSGAGLAGGAPGGGCGCTQ